MNDDKKGLGVPVETTVALSAVSPSQEPREDAAPIANAPSRGLEIALSICTGNDKHREWMNARFSVGDLNCATDGHLMAGFGGGAIYPQLPDDKKSYANQVRAWLTADPKAPGLIPFKGVLRTESIMAAAQEWPKTNKCKECNGSGEVMCTCECGDDHTRQCEDCNGRGHFPKGKERRDDKALVHLDGLAHFSAGVWFKLSEVAKYAGVRSFDITHGAGVKLMRLVAVDSPIIVCIMPSWSDGGNVFRTIRVSDGRGANEVSGSSEQSEENGTPVRSDGEAPRAGTPNT